MESQNYILSKAATSKTPLPSSQAFSFVKNRQKKRIITMDFVNLFYLVLELLLSKLSYQCLY